MKKVLIMPILLMVISTISIQSYAVQFHTVDCGNGKTIKVADSKYNPATNAFLCLKAKNNVSISKITSRDTFARANKKDKTVKRKLLRTRSSAQQGTSTPDHSDIILMLQGCECISESCVAYTCPADAKVP